MRFHCNLQLRHRGDEAGTPRAGVVELLDDLVPEVPGQDDDVVGPGRAQRVLGDDRDPAARHVLALLGRIAVDDPADQVGPHAGVVHERVALGGGTVGRDAAAGTPRLDQEGDEVVLDLVDPGLEAS